MCTCWSEVLGGRKSIDLTGGMPLKEYIFNYPTPLI